MLGKRHKVYRFTPFSQDAPPGMRGQCPLQLAGYDIRQVLMASPCTDLRIIGPLEGTRNPVPNS